MRQIKEQALKSKQSPLDKGFNAAESFLKFAGSARGVWELGKDIYSAGRAMAPYASAAATAISLL